MDSVYTIYTIDQMSTCRICGEAGHLAAKCKELGIPPDELYTGPGAERGGDDEEDSVSVLFERMPLVQNGSVDDEIQSTLQGQVWAIDEFPSKLSSGVEEVTSILVLQ